MRVIRRVGRRGLGWRGLGGRGAGLGSVGHIHAHVEVVVLVLLPGAGVKNVGSLWLLGPVHGL